MNLHEIVAGAIGSVNAHETVTLWANTGITVDNGIVTPSYAKTTVRAQIQAPSAADLTLNERIASAEHRIKVFLNAPASTINRVTQSAGDIIERADGTYWLVVGVKEDFSPEGWLCILAVLQTDPPEGVIVDADIDGS